MPKRANNSGTLYRRKGWFYGQLRVNGDIMRKALDTRDRREAEKRLNALAVGFDLSEQERLAALAVRLKPRNDRRTFGEAWIAYLRAPENATQSKTAQDNNKTIWDGFLRWLHGQDRPRSRLNCPAAYPNADCLDDITEKIASEFVEWIKTNRSPETANKYVRVLKRVWALNRVAESPWRGFRKFRSEPTQRRALSRAEVDFLIEKAEGELKTLFTIGAYTGMRLGDCQRLRWENVCGDRLMVRTSKTKRLAGIPIHPALAAALGKPKKSGFVLPEMARWPEWKASDAVQRHFAACGFEKPQKRVGYKRSMGTVGFHSLRSTFITRLGEAGVPLAVVREMVGHVSEDMSQRYFRADDSMAAKAIAALG